MKRFIIDHIGEIVITVTAMAALATVSEWFWLIMFEIGH